MVGTRATRALALACCTALTGLALSLVGAPPSTAQAPAATAPAAGGATGKPTGGLQVAFAAPPAPAAFGSPLKASLVISPDGAATSARLRLTSSGPVQLTGATSTEVAIPGETTVPVSFVVSGPGAGEVRAEVTGLDRAGTEVVVRSDSIWTDDAGGTSFQSTSGPLDARVQALTATKRGVPADEAARRLDQAIGGGSTGTAAVGAPKSQTVAAAATVAVSGRVRYTDSAGNLHPVRFAPVEIRDEELVGSDLVTTVTTDATGAYSATIDNDDGLLQGGRDVFIRVLARGDGFNVVSPGLFSSTHRIDSPALRDVADGAALTIDRDANAVDDNNTAFAVHDALVSTVGYVKGLLGAGLPAIDVDYPTTDSTSNFDGSRLHILRGDRFDWDVTNHEYGHYFMTSQGIENNPGGNHGLSDNLAENPGRNKDSGTRLAWGEGFPTYFGTVLQQVMGTAAFGIPNVGDVNYSDTDDANFSYSLETMVGGASKGEDNELAVQRGLWDLYDTPADGGDDRGLALGDAAVFSALKGAGAKTLSAAYGALIAGKPADKVADIGCIFTQQQVAPRITAPATDSVAQAATPPTITWDAGGGGPANRNDKFVVQFFDATFGTSLFESPEQGGTTFTPTKAQWTAILQGGGPLVNVVVRGRQTNAPATGPYTSCNIRLVAGFLDLVFVIDTTGSMGDDIGAVKAAGSQIVNAIAASGADYRIGLVDYKDLYSACPSDGYASRVDLPFSNTAAPVLAALNALGATGGCDIPESVYSGLMTAIGLPWRDGAKKSIILMGDAPPHDPEPVTGFTLAGVVAAAFAVDPAQIYTVEIGGGGGPLFERLASESGGAHFVAADASAVVAAILDAISVITGGPVKAVDCAGLTPTIVGTAGDDNMLMGTAGDDIIFGLGGNDQIFGLGGDDIICGGDGDDTLSGGDGNDHLFGGAGNDRLSGGIGDDELVGGDGADDLAGGPGNDRLTGGPGVDRISGDVGDDVIDVVDGAGGDQVTAGDHVVGDTCTGDPGDTLLGCNP